MFSREDIVLILNKIKQHYKLKNNVDFAAYLGISPQTLSNWYSRGTIDYELIYTKCLDISGDWLLSGTGEIARNSNNSFPCSECIVKDSLIEEHNKTISSLNKLINYQQAQITALETGSIGESYPAKQTG